MKFTELKKFIADGGGGVFLLQGEDAYFLSRGEAMIKKAYLTMPELNFVSFEGESLKGQNIARLTDALSSFPFMAEKRVVKVSEFYPSESDYEKYLKPFIADFPATAILIIVNTQTKKGAADLKKKGGINYFDCGKADEEEVTRWIYLTLKRAGIAANAEVCMNIARYCLCNMSRVSIETQKIIEYKGGEGMLTAEEADGLVYKDADYRIYEMTNAVAAGNYSRFCEISGELTSRGMDSMSVLNSLFSYMRNLATVAGSRAGDAELAKQLGMKEFAVKRTREQARRFGADRAEKLGMAIYSAIASVKCGEITQESAYRQVCSFVFFGQRGDIA